MAELVARVIIEMGELDLVIDFEAKAARCKFSYCPSTVTVCSMKYESSDYYYLSYIPHLHESTIYQVNTSHLHPFLQNTLYVHSGLSYLDNAYHASLSIFPIQPLSIKFFNREETNLSRNLKKSPHSSAVKEFGRSSLSDIVKLTNSMEGK